MEHSNGVCWKWTLHTLLSAVFVTWCESQVLWLEAQCWRVVVKHPQLLAWEQGVTWLSPRPHTRIHHRHFIFRCSYTQDHNPPSGMCSFVPPLEVSAQSWWQKVAGGAFQRALQGLALDCYLQALYCPHTCKLLKTDHCWRTFCGFPYNCTPIPQYFFNVNINLFTKYKYMLPV